MMSQEPPSAARLLRQAVLWCRAPLGVAAVAGLLFASAAHLAAIRGVDVEAAWPSVWLLHVGLFPLVVLAVVTASLRKPGARLTLRSFLGLIPLPWRLLLAAALGYATWTFFVYAPLGGAGDPMVHDGRYFFNDHGLIREVTEAQFHALRSVTLRLYSAVWVYLCLFSSVCFRNVRGAGDD
jgi:hypothetical protein